MWPFAIFASNAVSLCVLLHTIPSVILADRHPVYHQPAFTSYCLIYIFGHPAYNFFRPFAHPAPFKFNINNTSIIDADHDNDRNTPSQPQPVFAISHRLLALGSSPPQPDSPSNPSTMQSRTHSCLPSGNFGIFQAELGNVALKVGGTVLNDMMFLGGVVYSAAKSRMSHGYADHEGTRVVPAPSCAGGLRDMVFSRSAPATSGGGWDQRAWAGVWSITNESIRRLP